MKIIAQNQKRVNKKERGGQNEEAGDRNYLSNSDFGSF